jgi:hypothetical protein
MPQYNLMEIRRIFDEIQQLIDSGLQRPQDRHKMRQLCQEYARLIHRIDRN